jgi:hypothetical protein
MSAENAVSLPIGDAVLREIPDGKLKSMRDCVRDVIWRAI